MKEIFYERMKTFAVADTHAIIWYLLDDPRLSQKALSYFITAEKKEHNIGISVITIVEMVYLTEKNKIPEQALIRFKNVVEKGNNYINVIPMNREIAFLVSSISRKQVPDMPDRIIGATALHLDVPLITRDKKIKDSLIETIW